ncbi:MAG TPA: ABC transporter ATP-binding protein [Haliangiales bacterium]|nr:ABC transporter ATP-binding protein [Haliangiales bacterium]
MLLELTDVAKRYGQVTALRGLSGQIGVAGRRIGLLGPNGAGKSTLLKLLLGLTPFEGEARVLGLDPRRDALAIRDRVGYMPEMESYLAGMTAVQLCAYAGELSGLPRAAAMERAHAALYLCGLEDKRYLKVETYSTGMKQRVKLAQAVVHDPELLFLDEPTNGLDPAGREEMLALIADLPARRGVGVILSSHLLPDVERVCDEVMVLAAGRLEFTGTIGALRGDSEERFAVRVKDGLDKLAGALAAAGLDARRDGEELSLLLPGGDTDAVFAAARAAGVQIRHLAPLKRSLEAAFLEKVKA